jgi:dephospho-CoA kinase
LGFYFFIYLELGFWNLYFRAMLKVGLTGGIGSGKTTVAKIFELLGIPVYYADDAARKLMNEDEGLKAAIQKQFGKEAYNNGELNRTYISAKVFTDPFQLEILNSLVHPATIRDATSWMSRQTTSYTIKEAALIFESGSAEHLDYVVGVYAPASLRIRRAMERNHLGYDEVEQRMNKQLDESMKMKLCDFVIYNDEQQLLIPQVIALHEKLTDLSKRQPV